MDQLLPAFEASLFPDKIDTSIDFLADRLDSLIENETLKNTPIFKTVLELCKIGTALHERNLMRQTLAFLLGLNNGLLTEEQTAAYRKKVFKNQKRTLQELERILIVLNQQIDVQHSQILGLFYRAYVDQKIDWNTFCELDEINRRMFTSDYDALFNFELFEETETQHADRYREERLASLGLLQPMEGKQTWGDVENGTTKYELSSIGEIFYQYGNCARIERLEK